MCSRFVLLLQIREVPVPKYCDRQVLVEKVVKEIIEVPVRVPAPYEVEKLVEVERVTEKLVRVTSQQIKVLLIPPDCTLAAVSCNTRLLVSQIVIC